MVDHGRSWSTMVDHGRPGSTMGRPWTTMVDHGRTWSTIVEHGRPWSTMVDHGRAWSTMADHGRPWSTKTLATVLCTGLLSGAVAAHSVSWGGSGGPLWSVRWEHRVLTAVGDTKKDKHGRPWSTLVDHGRPWSVAILAQAILAQVRCHLARTCRFLCPRGTAAPTFGQALLETLSRLVTWHHGALPIKRKRRPWKWKNCRRTLPACRKILRHEKPHRSSSSNRHR